MVKFKKQISAVVLSILLATASSLHPTPANALVAEGIALCQAAAYVYEHGDVMVGVSRDGTCFLKHICHESQHYKYPYISIWWDDEEVFHWFCQMPE